MSNLTNIYAFLRNNYADIDVYYGNKPVTYLSRILEDFGDENKYLFIYKEDKSRKKSSSSTGSKRTPEKNVNSSLQDSLIGSPLKDDCEIDLIDESLQSKLNISNLWADTEESYSPIPINLARKISNEVSNETFPDNPRGKLWILCTGDGSTLLMGSDFQKEWNCRDIIKYRKQVPFREISIEKLLAAHFTFIAPTTKLETKIETFFDLNPNMKLKFVNYSTSRSPSLAVDESSEVTLYQCIEIGQENSVSSDFWSQIYLLHKIKEDIIQYKENEIDEKKELPVYRWGLGVEFEKLQEQINKTLEIISVPEEDDGELELDHTLEAVIKKAKNRPLIDLTDQLWDILKYAASYTVLKNALTYLFQVAIRSNIVNIPTNNNRIAELIRDLTQQRLAIPNLSATEPLELLLEIGIEKLLKDYEFIFSESKICSLKDIKFNDEKPTGKIDPSLNVRKSLAASRISSSGAEKARKTLLHINANAIDQPSEIVGIRNSRFVENEVNLNISKLAQIHLLIEHLQLIQINLNLDNDYAAVARRVFEKPLISFEALQEMALDKLEIPILSKKANQLVEKTFPSAKKIVMKSENKFRKIENIFYYNTDLIVPPNVVGLKIDENAGINERSATYHYFHATKISTQAF